MKLSNHPTCVISIFQFSSFLFFFKINFRVQIAAFEEPKPASYFIALGVETYLETTDQLGLYRYFAGSYPTRIEAAKVQQEMIAKGFPFASIIDLEEQRILREVGCPYFRNGMPLLQEPEPGMTMRNIYFEFGAYQLSVATQTELNHIAEQLKQNSWLKLKVLGYTDGIGDPQANVELAASRARGARNYLINKGIRADRMFISVFGEADPVLPNGEEVSNGKTIDLPENRKWNRRVVLVIVDDTVK